MSEVRSEVWRGGVGAIAFAFARAVSMATARLRYAAREPRKQSPAPVVSTTLGTCM